MVRFDFSQNEYILNFINYGKKNQNMNYITVFSLKILKKIYSKISKRGLQKPECEKDPEKVSTLMLDILNKDSPAMIARFGAFELSTVYNYIGVKKGNKKILSYLKGNSPQWWWNEKLLQHLKINAGFFPINSKSVAKYCELTIEDMKQVDILGSWLIEESFFIDRLSKAVFVQREIQNPFFTKEPWTKALRGKKVLVIHPFDELIQKQYLSKRDKLFENPDVLPEFTLKTLKAVQSIGGSSDQFDNWFSALDWMKSEMDKTDYDICLIGCGAYGFSLAAHAKRQGKKAVHLGGSLQLLFGIIGKRWENPNYNENYNYAALINEYWIRPGEQEKPKGSKLVEDACYW